MLLVVSTTFLITSTPIVTLQTVELTSSDRFGEPPTLKIIKGIFLSLQYLNHSINFFLYAVTGKTFRREFFGMFRPFFKKKDLHSTGTLSTANNLTGNKGVIYKPVRQVREFQRPRLESNV